ncbi:MAG: hypothetical protein FP827_05120 [Candidatus Omnitrophica bacterium]|nr:hypothetical protein [Candidatus Omnitrophota bacterium]
MTYIFYNGRNQIEAKSSHVKYQDAYVFPDGKGVLIISQTRGYEGKGNIENINMKYQHLNGYIKDLKGNQIYWTGEDSFAIVRMPRHYDNNKDVKLYHYKKSQFEKEEAIDFAIFKKRNYKLAE